MKAAITPGTQAKRVRMIMRMNVPSPTPFRPMTLSAAEALEFERAADLRDQIKALRKGK